MEIKEYLKLCTDQISSSEYLEFEKIRKKSKTISGINWVELIEYQSFKCHYCNTHLAIIQELLFHNIIKPRKRGVNGYSGMHFELDHKNADKNDNNRENLVASCYYCNNDKSNTINFTLFENYFGPKKGMAFSQLFNDNKLTLNNTLRHHLKGKTK